MLTQSPVLSTAVQNRIEFLHNSEQSLEEIQNLVSDCPGHYYAWQLLYEKACSSRDLAKNLLCFVNRIITSNAKNYQPWNFKKNVLKFLQSEELDPVLLESELNQSLEMLLKDSRNLHAWDFRCWLFVYFEITPKVETELSFLYNISCREPLNNSIITHILFLVQQQSDEDFATIMHKLEAVILQTIRNAPLDETFICFAHQYVAAWLARTEDVTNNSEEHVKYVYNALAKRIDIENDVLSVLSQFLGLASRLEDYATSEKLIKALKSRFNIDLYNIEFTSPK